MNRLVVGSCCSALLALLSGCARPLNAAKADSVVPSQTVAAAEKPAELPAEPPLSLPRAVVDLASRAGCDLLHANWRYSDVRIVEAVNRAAGADLKPSGAAIKTNDYSPKIGTPGFDSANWLPLEPSELEARRGNGKLSFAWYRVGLTLPERVGELRISGSTATLELVVDDYAEVWVDGKLAPRLGDHGGAVVAGFNAPNRVLLSDAARPGQHFEIAVFAINGPISATPANFIWLRSATLEFHAPEAPSASFGRVERLDPELDQLIGTDARVERLARGFVFTEGPTWNAKDGALLFSDPNQNQIFRFDPASGLSVFRSKSGYKGFDIGKYHQPGSNGLALDREGRLTINEHGNRRVTRLEPTGALTVLADQYQGKRLNSPNDLVYKRDGSLYFTDPPFGLPGVFEDPHKELPYSGVFRWSSAGLQLVNQELSGPNGLAFSPDEQYLYVDNWDPRRKVVMRYRVAADGALSEGQVFFDLTSAPGEEAFDGLKVAANGDVLVSGPGGVHVLSPTGKHLGVLHVAELPANFAWGDADHRTLYMTARTGLYRVRLLVPGASAFFE